MTARAARVAGAAVLALTSGARPAAGQPVDPAAAASPGPPAIPPTRAPVPPGPPAIPPIPDQALGGAIGPAAGGRVTPGGLRISGRYLYQLAERDWLDGTASFTFGSNAARCFRDRADRVVCDHGLADGGGIELALGVRRMLGPPGRFQPFARAAVGLALLRFTSDDVTGLALPLHAGAGLRAAVSPALAITAHAEITTGAAWLGRGLGAEPLLGLAVTAGAELRLR
jgi:hypothetical protein